jgi:hypothetical protein
MRERGNGTVPAGRVTDRAVEGLSNARFEVRHPPFPVGHSGG